MRITTLFPLGLGLLVMGCDNSTIDSEPPLGDLLLTAPQDGDTLTAETLVQIVSPDFDRFIGVGLRVDGEEVAVSLASPFNNSLDVSAWADGLVHEFQAWAVSEGSQVVESDTIQVTIHPFAAPPALYTVFYRTHGGTGDDWVQDLEQAGNGWLAAGSSDDRAWLIRLDRQGDRVWQWQFGTGNGQLNVVERDPGAGLVVAGKLDGMPWLGLLDVNGHLLSSRTYASTGEGSITDLLPLESGGWLALANTQGGSRLMELDATGAVIWSRDPTVGGNTSLERMVRDEAGDVWICGALEPEGERRVILLRTDSNGSRRWQRNLAAGHAWDLAPEGDGVVIAGEAGVSTDVAVATLWRTDSVGELLESRAVTGNTPHSAHRLLKSPTNTWWIAGWSAGSLSSGLDAMLAEVSFSAGTVWQQPHGLTGGEELRALLRSSDGGLLSAGMTSSTGNGGLGGWFLHTNLQGVMAQ